MAWRELNASHDWLEFYKEVQPLCTTLPQLVYHQTSILDALLSRLDMRYALSLEPLLDLLVHLSRDLASDFVPHFPRAVEAIEQVVMGCGDSGDRMGGASRGQAFRGPSSDVAADDVAADDEGGVERDGVAGRRMTARGDIEEALEEYGWNEDEEEEEGGTREEEKANSFDEDEYNLEDDDADDGKNEKKYNAVLYEGRAANIPSKWLNRFQKVFYKAPRDKRFAKDDPYQPVTYRGRVPLRGLGKHVLRDKLPLYFSTSDANISSDRMKIENTMEYVDPLALHYSSEYLKFRAPGEVSDLTGEMETKERKTSLPVKWPPVVANFFPFDILTDYVRPLGPGILVGNGFRGESQTTFLKFLLVRGDYLDAERKSPKLTKLEK